MRQDAEAVFDAVGELERVVSSDLDKLYRTASRYLDNPEDVKEAVQDALLSAFRHVSEFQQRSQMSTWLTRIVINAALMKIRSRARQKTVSLDETEGEDDFPLTDQLVDARPNPEQVCEHAEVNEIIAKELAHLSPGLRRAYELCDKRGWSMQEASALLGVSESALKCRLLRARRTLREPLRNMLRLAPSETGRASSGRQRLPVSRAA